VVRRLGAGLLALALLLGLALLLVHLLRLGVARGLGLAGLLGAELAGQGDDVLLRLGAAAPVRVGDQVPPVILEGLRALALQAIDLGDVEEEVGQRGGGVAGLVLAQRLVEHAGLLEAHRRLEVRLGLARGRVVAGGAGGARERPRCDDAGQEPREHSPHGADRPPRRRACQRGPASIGPASIAVPEESPHATTRRAIARSRRIVTLQP
jgi:hypothetical protein